MVDIITLKFLSEFLSDRIIFAMYLGIHLHQSKIIPVEISHNFTEGRDEKCFEISAVLSVCKALPPAHISKPIAFYFDITPSFLFTSLGKRSAVKQCPPPLLPPNLQPSSASPSPALVLTTMSPSTSHMIPPDQGPTNLSEFQ